MSRLEELRKNYGFKGHVEYAHDIGLLGPDVLAAHCVWVTQKEIQILRSTGTKVVHNPGSNMYLGSGIAPVPRLLDLGIPAEDSRFVLPNAACTNIIVTMNARSLLNFFELRCCQHAQWEIRKLANKMLHEVKKVAPTIFNRAGPLCKSKRICPESILHYIYASLHAPSYRLKYADFLKYDFPRIPFSDEYKIFSKMAESGEKLVNLHLQLIYIIVLNRLT